MAFSLLPMSVFAEAVRDSAEGDDEPGSGWNQGWGGWETLKPDVGEGLFFENDLYRVRVTNIPEAQIPEGTKLLVSEIPYGSEEYQELWDRSLEKLNENAAAAVGEEASGRRAICNALFLDLTLEYEGQPFEPDVPLQVEIEMNGGLYCPEDQEAVVIHFGDNETELIEEVAVTESDDALPDGMPEGALLNSFDYEQTGFSVVGLVTTDVYIDFEAAQPATGFITADALLASVKAAGDPTIDAGKSVTDNNGDGIYELALSVKATSQQSSQASVTKSNVVMVIDVSGSMGNDDSWIYYDTYTYDAATYDDFRFYTSSTSTATRLYYGTVTISDGFWSSHEYTGWYTATSNMWGTTYTEYSGTVYAYETRLHATQRASCAVVDALLAYNNNDDNITDVFEITVVKFANRTANNQQGYNGTQMVIRDSTSATDIKNAINGLTSGGGTNWQAALETALTEANYFKNEGGNENTSVIFLTDGFPTFYGNDTGYSSGYGPGATNYAGQEQADNIALCYTNSRTAARNIVSNGYTLYGIFAFGSDTQTYNNHTGFAYLRALTNYAYGSGTTDNYNETDTTRQYDFNAKSTADLLKAFNTIIDHITNNVGYAGVNLTDGVSLGATSTSVAVNGTAKAESMRYTVKDEAGKIAYTVKIDSNGAATFTIYNADGTTTTQTDNAPSEVTTTINGTEITSQVYSVTVGTGDDAKTYEMAPAAIDAATGMVTWNLAGLGILESGYTYTVAFDVWPNQTAYDICADLNNGIYASVDAALDAYGVTDAATRQHIKDALLHNADGSYSLYTNYEQSVEYYPATSETDDEGNVTWTYGDKQEQPIPQPDPIPLKGSLLPLAKVWESNLAISELNELLWENGVEGGTSKEYQITLKVWKADTKAEIDAIRVSQEGKTPYITETLGWDSTENKYIWEKNVAVAPGMMLNVEEAAALGYDTTVQANIKKFTNDQGDTLEYYVIESGHYFYVTEEGGDLHFYLDEPIYHPMIVDGTLYNVFFGSGQEVERMDPMYAVEATNYLKGGLNITKVILDFENNEVKNVEDEFAFKITIWNDEDGTVKPVYTYDDQFESNYKAISGSIGYREFGVDENGEFVTLGRNVIVFEDTPNAAEKLEANKRGDNDPVYATKTSDGKTQIILRMPANGEIRLVNLPNHTKYTVEEIVDTSDDAVYEYVKTESAVKYTKNEQGQEEEVIDVLETVTTNTVSGTVTGNKASVATYYNKTDAFFYVYHSSDNTVEKISFTDNRVKGTFNTETSKYEYSFNIADETKTGSLYGGYYSNYVGKGSGYNSTALTFDEDNWAKDTGEGVKPYTGANVVKNTWVLSEALTVNGLEMAPAQDSTYFLKEVPADKYLRPYLHYTYKTGEGLGNVCTSWLISDLDDTNYTHTGFVIIDKNNDAEKVLESLTITTTTGNSTIRLTPKRVFQANSGNFLTYLTVFNDGRNGEDTVNLLANGNLVMQYWVTPDNLIVTGTNSRVYKGLGHVSTIGVDTEETDAYSVKLYTAPDSGDGN